MDLRWALVVHLYNVFLENDGKENCAQLIEEEFNKMFGVNDEHDYKRGRHSQMCHKHKLRNLCI